MELIDILWISIERSELRQCLYETKNGCIIFRIENGVVEMLPEYEASKDILKEVCLNWDTSMSYDYSQILSIKREKKLISILEV